MGHDCDQSVLSAPADTVSWTMVKQSDDPNRPLPWDDQRAQVRKMIAVLDEHIQRLSRVLSRESSDDLTETVSLRDRLASLLADLERGRPARGW
jgi:hypothetical protein